VLTDIGVVSSGEAIAIAFRGRPNTRSFGTPTCGLSTGVQQIPLETGGRVAVVNSVIVDRTKKRYGGVLQPDVAITEPSAIVPRALAWLRTR
jgi:carboxyl-terminal processing protease